MDIRRALVYLFQDPRWVGKLGLATVLNLLPVTLGMLPSLPSLGLAVPTPLATLTSSPFWYVVVGLAAVPVSGYLLRITRQVLVGQDAPLPAWADVSGILRDGLLFWGLVSLWGLPNVILNSFAGLSSRSPGDRGATTVMLAQLLVMVVVLIIQVIEPAAEARLAATGSFARGMDVRAAVRTVRANRGGYVRLWLVTVVGALLMIGLATGVVALATIVTGHELDWMRSATLGAVLFGLTLGVYAGFVLAHLRAQVYAEANKLPFQGRDAQLVGGTSAD